MIEDDRGLFYPNDSIHLGGENMTRTKFPYMAIIVFTIAAMLLAACQTAETPAATPTTGTVEQPTPPPAATQPPADTPAPAATTAPADTPTAETSQIGTAAHPIKVLFVPSVDAQVIVSGGQIMAEALREATGLEFEVSVPTSYATTIEEMCASPEDSMAFIPAQGYVLANEHCGVDVALKAVRRGWGIYWAQILVGRDSDIDSIDDLDGLSWAYPDAGSTSGYLYPQVMFNDAGITPGETVEAGGHPGVVRAVYNGEVDFGTTYFSPWEATGVDPWEEGDPPDVPDEVVESCGVSGNALMCGEYQVLDARATLREEAPDVVQRVRILTLTDPIPNDTLSFGPDFPQDLRDQIVAALIEFAETDEWDQSIGSEDFYGWSSVEAATDQEYDPVRQIVALAGITLENIGQ
jgi:phosphonate transport system substrate-binding protein